MWQNAAQTAVNLPPGIEPGAVFWMQAGGGGRTSATSAAGLGTGPPTARSLGDDSLDLNRHRSLIPVPWAGLGWAVSSSRINQDLL